MPVFDGIVNERIKPFLNSFPSIGWAILASIWFTAGNFGVMFVEIAILIPFCLINIDQGFRAIDRELIEMGRSFTRKPTRIWSLITLRRSDESGVGKEGVSPCRSRGWQHI